MFRLRRRVPRCVRGCGPLTTPFGYGPRFGRGFPSISLAVSFILSTPNNRSCGYKHPFENRCRIRRRRHTHQRSRRRNLSMRCRGFLVCSSLCCPL